MALTLEEEKKTDACNKIVMRPHFSYYPVHFFYTEGHCSEVNKKGKKDRYLLLLKGMKRGLKDDQFQVGSHRDFLLMWHNNVEI